MSEVSTPRDQRRKVLIVGLDGGTLDVIGPLVETERMPNMARLMAEGILVAARPAIREGIVEGARIENLAPTALHLLGMAAPSDMDGRVLEDLLAGEWLDAHPAVHERHARRENTNGDSYVYSEAEAEQVREQLSGLGYL